MVECRLLLPYDHCLGKVTKPHLCHYTCHFTTHFRMHTTPSPGKYSVLQLHHIRTIHRTIQHLQRRIPAPLAQVSTKVPHHFYFTAASSSSSSPSPHPSLNPYFTPPLSSSPPSPRVAAFFMISTRYSLHIYFSCILLRVLCLLFIFSSKSLL